MNICSMSPLLLVPKHVTKPFAQTEWGCRDEVEAMCVCICMHLSVNKFSVLMTVGTGMS